MLIDAHVHVKGGDKYRREFTPAEILEAMEDSGVDQSVIFSICLPSRQSNELTMRCYQAAPDRFIPFAHVIVGEGRGALDELDRCMEQFGMRGLKLHKGEMEEPYFTNAAPVLERCIKWNCPVTIDVGNNYEFGELIAREYPELKLIICHLGSSNDEDMVNRFIALATECPHMTLDISYSHVPWKIPEAIERLGAHRFVWGSDGPLQHPVIELAKLKICKLGHEDFQKITYNNIIGLLRPI